jgi:RNA polymerase sigma-70 factor (ECF subfamily)
VLVIHKDTRNGTLPENGLEPIIETNYLSLLPCFSVLLIKHKTYNAYRISQKTLIGISMAKNRTILSTEKIKSMTDEVKIIKAARRDPRVFGELYKLYVEQVFRYLYSRIGNMHEAEDITAETFLAAFESFDRFRQDEHFASWLFTIARNKATDYFRQQKNTASIDKVVDIPEDNDPLSEVIYSEQTAALTKLIRALPEEERELLRVRFLAGMSFPEIAHFLNRNEEAVKKSIYRLLARLHGQLEV